MHNLTISQLCEYKDAQFFHRTLSVHNDSGSTLNVHIYRIPYLILFF